MEKYRLLLIAVFFSAIPAKAAALEFCAPNPARLEALSATLMRALSRSARLEFSTVSFNEGETCAELTLKAAADSVPSTNRDRLVRLLLISGKIRVHVLDAGVEFPALISKKTGDRTGLTPCARYFQMPCTLGTDSKSLAEGMTLFPVTIPLVDSSFYSTTERTEVYFAAKQTELEVAKTVFHELVHAEYYAKTGSIEHSGHVGPGAHEVNRDCAQAESEVARFWTR